ncbi:spindle pole body component ALP4 [Pseudohyphozyma bogoriensis]|nr:spindle pole body component ALP4 [Pseudohyphozyma bogoriensis]
MSRYTDKPERPERSESRQSISRQSTSRQSTSGSLPPSLSLSSRPPSSLGSTSTYQRPGSAFGTAPKTPKPSASRYGGFADKDLQRIESTIRTATKTIGGTTKSRTIRERDEIVEQNESSFRAEPAPPGSFIAETSFSHAPLSSRLPPTSPHRVVSASSRKSSASSRVPADKKAKGKQRVQSDEDDGLDSFDSEREDEFEEEEQLVEEKGEVERPDREELKGLPAELQEALLVEDLLFVLMGIEGQYIEYDESYSPEDEYERLRGAQFTVDPQLLPWLKELVELFLPMAKYYTGISAFIEQYSVLDHGVINHALCAAIREMLREYLVLLVQLEHQFLTSPTFSLRTLWFYLNPTLHTLSLLYSLTSSLVALDVPPEDDSSESEPEEAESDDSFSDEGMRQVAREMKAAAAGIHGAAKQGSAWQGGIAKGGEVLAVISEKLERTSGDPTALELYSTLLLQASQPYVGILLAWITTGQLADPWEEFIVKEAKGITTGSLNEDYTDEYWERRYTLRDKSAKKVPKSSSTTARARGLAGGAIVPAFLEPWKNKILLAGKYLNVIRECGIEIKVPEETMEGLVSLDDPEFYKRIDDAYTYANKLLLKLLLEDQLLTSRLLSIKRYFFLDPADVFTHFLDLAKAELAKKKKATSLSKLQGMLEMALSRNPYSAADTYKDDLTVKLESSALTTWLVKVISVEGVAKGSGRDGADALGDGLVEEKKKDDAKQEKAAASLPASDVFTLDYIVRFPLNLVISAKTIVRYQLIFRYLLQLKLLERSLAETWMEQTKSPYWRSRSPYPELETFKARVIALRTRMLAFVQQMYSFAVGEVLEPNWRQLEGKLEKVETVDQLLTDHVDFLNNCMNSLLLTANEDLLKVHEKLTTVCALFTTYGRNFTRAIAMVTNASEEAGRYSGEQLVSTWENFKKIETHFDHHLTIHRERVGFTASRENTALLPLHLRLNNLKRTGTD